MVLFGLSHRDLEHQQLETIVSQFAVSLHFTSWCIETMAKVMSPTFSLYCLLVYIAIHNVDTQTIKILPYVSLIARGIHAMVHQVDVYNRVFHHQL